MGVARANEFDDFQNARSAYDVGSYELSASLFDSLVGGDVPRLQNRSLVLESLKYLGASLLFIGQPDGAEEAFERLLRMEIDYVLDPLAFPQEVQTVFDRVKQRLMAQLEESREAEQAVAAARAREAEVRRLAEQARLERLVALASMETVEEKRSRLVAMVPFGVGQFQNDHDGLGLVLAVSETALLGVSVVSYFLHDDLATQQPSKAQLDDARFAERAFRYTNQISLGLFAVVAITGIIDAQMRFAGSQTFERPRNIDPELRKPFEVSATPTGVRIRF